MSSSRFRKHKPNCTQLRADDIDYDQTLRDFVANNISRLSLEAAQQRLKVPDGMLWVRFENGLIKTLMRPVGEFLEVNYGDPELHEMLELAEFTGAVPALVQITMAGQTASAFTVIRPDINAKPEIIFSVN